MRNAIKKVNGSWNVTRGETTQMTNKYWVKLLSVLVAKHKLQQADFRCHILGWTYDPALICFDWQSQFFLYFAAQHITEWVSNTLCCRCGKTTQLFLKWGVISVSSETDAWSLRGSPTQMGIPDSSRCHEELNLKESCDWNIEDSWTSEQEN